MVRLRQIGFVLLMALLLAGCNARALREAERTLAMADSLRAEGTAYTDSVRLAETVDALQSHQRWHPAAWAKANYYYGRLLYDSGNYVASMASFIRASHAHARDKVLLGRVYSNMAYMCREKGEHALAYEVYNTSADIFLRAGDSIRYFYALDNMLFELAAQKDSSVFALLDSINTHCSDRGVQMKTLEIKTTAFEYFGQYDSVLTYTEQLHVAGYKTTTTYMGRARAFLYLEQPDSALYYAGKVIENSLSESARYDALYILTHCDTTLNTDSLLSLSADRADYGKAVEKKQANLAQAVQLLQQDRERKPNRSWVYVGILVMIVVALVIIALLIMRRQHLQMQSVVQELQKIQSTDNNTKPVSAINGEQLLQDFCEQIKSLGIEKALHWDDYPQMCQEVDMYLYGFVRKLKQQPPKATLCETDVRLCILTLLQFSMKEMSAYLHRSLNSIKNLKQVAAHKLGVSSAELYPLLKSLIR